MRVPEPDLSPESVKVVDDVGEVDIDLLGYSWLGLAVIESLDTAEVVGDGLNETDTEPVPEAVCSLEGVSRLGLGVADELPTIELLCVGLLLGDADCVTDRVQSCENEFSVPVVVLESVGVGGGVIVSDAVSVSVGVISTLADPAVWDDEGVVLAVRLMSRVGVPLNDDDGEIEKVTLIEATDCEMSAVRERLIVVVKDPVAVGLPRSLESDTDVDHDIVGVNVPDSE